MFLYDYIQLLPEEVRPWGLAQVCNAPLNFSQVEYIWKVKGPKINILYVVCRYTNFFIVGTTIISV